jgi:hypothetical protein
MLPELKGGDFIIATRLHRTIKVGDLLVINHLSYGRIIKRVLKISAQKGISIAGNNKESVSPEQLGWIQKQQVHGKVIFRIKQKI